MSSLILLLFSISAALSAAQDTICVWGAEGTLDEQNGEYTLAGTTTSSHGDANNYWEKSSANCPQYIQAIWWDEDNIHFWSIHHTITTAWDGVVTECGSDWRDFPANPLLCQNGWDDWTSGAAVALPITLQSGACPSLTCPYLQVTNSGVASCDQVFHRDSANSNVFTYTSGLSTTYLYFNANTFKWYCSDTLDTDTCDEDDTITHPYVSSKSDGWNDISIGGEFTLTLSNDHNALFQCIQSTANPTRAPTQMPTMYPIFIPTTTPISPPTATPTSIPTVGPTITRSQEQTPSPTAATTRTSIGPETINPTTKPTNSPIWFADPSGTETTQNTDEGRPQGIDDNMSNGIDLEIWIIAIVACFVSVCVCFCLLSTVYGLCKSKNKLVVNSKMMEGTTRNAAITNVEETGGQIAETTSAHVGMRATSITADTGDDTGVEMVPPPPPPPTAMNTPQMINDLIQRQKIRMIQLQSETDTFDEAIGEGVPETDNIESFQSDIFFANHYAKNVNAFQPTKGIPECAQYAE